jgi:hypothetical protein
MYSRLDDGVKGNFTIRPGKPGNHEWTRKTDFAHALSSLTGLQAVLVSEVSLAATAFLNACNEICLKGQTPVYRFRGGSTFPSPWHSFARARPPALQQKLSLASLPQPRQPAAALSFRCLTFP